VYDKKTIEFEKRLCRATSYIVSLILILHYACVCNVYTPHAANRLSVKQCTSEYIHKAADPHGIHVYTSSSYRSLQFKYKTASVRLHGVPLKCYVNSITL